MVLMAEVSSELTYVRHHKQKIVHTLASMRQYAEALEEDGVSVRYVTLGDAGAADDLPGEVLRALRAQPFERVVMTRSGEHRLERAFDALEAEAPVPVERREDDRFLCSRQRFFAWSRGRKELRMEDFYREMRKETGLLMQGAKPAGGRWNFDKDNRKRLPAKLEAPERLLIEPNAAVRELIALVERDYAENFGDTAEFAYATTAEDAERLAAHFFRKALPLFGDFQDFMRAGDPWLWHARISAALNIGFLDPLDLCRRAEAEWKADRAPLNAVEGFIRQILGWREFVRGVYQLRGEDYGKINALEADRDLPWFYWSGETDMACVKDVVAMTRAHAYAHHIQRLMVTGNLAMLLAVHPDLVDEWYMVVYADAYEWVEQPNTRGMATFADGGIVASKPYAASGAYINRMSDYCSGCAYEVKERTTEKACPFNALYWDFMMRNEKRLRDNPRIGYAYATLEKLGADERGAIRKRAHQLQLQFGAKVLP